MKTTQEQRKILRRIEADVKRVGLSIMFIFGEEGRPPFFYTVGRGKRGLPELICTLPIRPEVGQALLNHLDHLMPEPLPTESLVAVGGKYPGLVIDAGPEAQEDWTFMATAFNGGADKYRVQQIIVPDREGRYAPDGDPPFSQQLLLGPRRTLQ